MNLMQMGYLGNVGPVFVGTMPTFNVIVLQGVFDGTKLNLKAKDPTYVDFLKNTDYFPYSKNDCTLGSYKDGDIIDEIVTSYKHPVYGTNSFSDYRKLASDWTTEVVNTPPTKIQDPPSPKQPQSPTPNQPSPSNTGGNSNSGSGSTTNGQKTVIQKDMTASNNLLIGCAILAIFLILRNQNQ